MQAQLERLIQEKKEAWNASEAHRGLAEKLAAERDSLKRRLDQQAPPLGVSRDFLLKSRLAIS